MNQPPVTCLHTHFASLTDPRIERTKLHHLLDIIAIAVCAVLVLKGNQGTLHREVQEL
jgi:hypothetical protein